MCWTNYKFRSKNWIVNAWSRQNTNMSRRLRHGLFSESFSMTLRSTQESQEVIITPLLLTNIVRHHSITKIWKRDVFLKENESNIFEHRYWKNIMDSRSTCTSQWKNIFFNTFSLDTFFLFSVLLTILSFLHARRCPLIDSSPSLAYRVSIVIQIRMKRSPSDEKSRKVIKETYSVHSEYLSSLSRSLMTFWDMIACKFETDLNFKILSNSSWRKDTDSVKISRSRLVKLWRSFWRIESEVEWFVRHRRH